MHTKCCVCLIFRHSFFNKLIMECCDFVSTGFINYYFLSFAPPRCSNTPPSRSKSHFLRFYFKILYKKKIQANLRFYQTLKVINHDCTQIHRICLLFSKNVKSYLIFVQNSINYMSDLIMTDSHIYID